jgi:bifunctional enzyme CysN/CysC
MKFEKTNGGVIWLTGYSAAGKTTIARIVVTKLKQAGTPAIHLDGDDLRAILANKWGYSTEERRELAKVYLLLCSNLAAQGVTVVISAVAMYSEVYNWFKKNVPGAVLIYIDVPKETRHQRDAKTKQVYVSPNLSAQMYEEPIAPDLLLANPDGADINSLALQVINRFEDLAGRQADRGKSIYWDKVYQKRDGVQQPSPFALHVSEVLEAHGGAALELVEVGCGNGRDASHFARLGFRVTGLDTSRAAIEHCIDTFGEAARFQVGTLGRTEPQIAGTDVVYCRFVLHAMTPDEEREFLLAVQSVLKPGGLLFIEARSIYDPLARKGEVLSPTERIEGHYRRFIIADELQRQIEGLGLWIESLVESNGLARFGDEDPVVVRLAARKP